MTENLRFGILSTASINEYGFVPPAKKLDGVEIRAIASRDSARARKFARRHGVPKYYGDYNSLLADPAIDCVYVPLPVSMHAEWSIKALRAGKHVLCEKPMTAGAAEAEAVLETVRETGLVFMEAFHYRYHPLIAKLEEIVKSGELGDPVEISASLCANLPDRSKVQFNPSLAGGALYDTGCYPVSFVRVFAGCEGYQVVSAESEMTSSGVDGTTRATIHFDNGVTGKIHCSIIKLLPVWASIKGTKGEIFVHMPFSPAFGLGPVTLDLYFCLMRKGLSFKNIRVATTTTYFEQLKAFRDCVLKGSAPLTDAVDGLANMRMIDAIYEAAGVK